MKAKEIFIRRSAFLKPPPNFIEPLIIFCGMVYIKINEEIITQALIYQLTNKSLSPDKINFRILQMI